MSLLRTRRPHPNSSVMFQTVWMEAGRKSLSEIHRTPGSSDNSPSLQIAFGSSVSRVWNIDTTFHVGAFPFDLSVDTAQSSSHSSLWPGVGPAMISVSHFTNDNHVLLEKASRELALTSLPG